MTRKERNAKKAEAGRKFWNSTPTAAQMESINREIEASAETVRDTVAEAKRRGVPTAQVLRERRAGK